MSNFEEFKEEWLKDKEVKEYYDELQPDYAIIQALIEARVKKKITQKDLSIKTEITQADIDSIENGTIDLNLSTLKKLAKLIDTRVKIEFVSIK